MDILRFITAGSVDDGKSTLIGRLLYLAFKFLAAGYNLFFKLVEFKVPIDWVFLAIS